MTLNWLGYARTGKEFAVMDDLADVGIKFWRGERIEFERRGKQRTPEPYHYPALPNYIWIMPEPRQVHLLSGIRHLSKFFYFLSDGRYSNNGAAGSVEAMQAFRARAEARAAEAMRIAGNRQAIVQYKAGEVLKITDGIFAGELAVFSEMVKRGGDTYEHVKAYIDRDGSIMPLVLDPLSVRRSD